jgi:hypothetical protein
MERAKLGDVLGLVRRESRISKQDKPDNGDYCAEEN